MFKKNINYTIELKLKAVKIYLDSGIKSTKIVKLLNLNSKNRVFIN